MAVLWRDPSAPSITMAPPTVAIPAERAARLNNPRRGPSSDSASSARAWRVAGHHGSRGISGRTASLAPAAAAWRRRSVRRASAPSPWNTSVIRATRKLMALPRLGEMGPAPPSQSCVR